MAWKECPTWTTEDSDGVWFTTPMDTQDTPSQDVDVVQEIRDIIRNNELPFEEIVTESVVKYLHDEDKLGTAICELFDMNPGVVGDIHIDIPAMAPVIITFKCYPALLRNLRPLDTTESAI